MSTEEKQPAWEQLEHFLEVMDKSAPEGSKRVAVPLGEDQEGEQFGIIVWREK